MAKTAINTGETSQPVHTRSTAGTEESQAVVIAIDGSDSVVPANATTGLGVNVLALVALPAGTNNIGDVDIADMPGASRITDSNAVALATDAIMSNTTPLTPKYASINRATNADGAAVINLVAAKRLRILTYTLVCAGAVGVKWQSSTSNTTGTGTNTDLTAVMSFAANGGASVAFSPVGLFETISGEALKLNLNAAVQVSGHLTYIEF